MRHRVGERRVRAGRHVRLLPGHDRRQPALSCLRKPEQMDGRTSSLSKAFPRTRGAIMGDAFVLEGGVQCGFCIPGHRRPRGVADRQGKTDDRAAIAKALDGHLCRCTGYGRIIDAIQTAGEAAGGRQSQASVSRGGTTTSAKRSG